MVNPPSTSNVQPKEEEVCENRKWIPIYLLVWRDCGRLNDHSIDFITVSSPTTTYHLMARQEDVGGDNNSRASQQSIPTRKRPTTAVKIIKIQLIFPHNCRLGMERTFEMTSLFLLNLPLPSLLGWLVASWIIGYCWLVSHLVSYLKSDGVRQSIATHPLPMIIKMMMMMIGGGSRGSEAWTMEN